MSNVKSKQLKRERRHRRIRAKVSGTSTRPRLSVFRSNRALSAQLIDDEKAVTLAAASSLKAPGKNAAEKARAVGQAIALQAKGKQISSAVFDRGGYLYAGAIKALAEGAREGGLKF
ncbi:MAG: 50S ribosomal protein L18 [bacterium]|nr:50S ribosomal protein L18 [bacterium]